MVCASWGQATICQTRPRGHVRVLCTMCFVCVTCIMHISIKFKLKLTHNLTGKSLSYHNITFYILTLSLPLSLSFFLFFSFAIQTSSIQQNFLVNFFLLHFDLLLIIFFIVFTIIINLLLIKRFFFLLYFLQMFYFQRCIYL